VTVGSVEVIVNDNDEVGVTVSPLSLSVDENGGVASYTVVLHSEPGGRVIISVTSSDPAAATVSPSSLTFGHTDWSTPQTVTVTGVNDDIDNPGDQRIATITHSASGNLNPAIGYSALAVDPVTVTVLDDDRGIDPGPGTGGGNTRGGGNTGGGGGFGIGNTGGGGVGSDSPPLSSDPTLGTLAGHTSTDGLDFSDVLALIPDFSAEMENYAADVPHSITHVTLTPTVNDSNATVKVGMRDDALTGAASGEPAPAIALAVGENIIDVEVMAEDGSTVRTYVLTITRDAAPPVKLDDAAAREHLFPLIADGEGFRSHLFLTNVTAPDNRCTLELHGTGFDAARFEKHAALTAGDAGIEITLGDTGADLILATAGEQGLALGYAKLACTTPAVARMLLVQESGGVPTAMTTLERAPTLNAFQFPVLPRLGRLGLVLANDNALDAACAVEVTSADGASVGGGSLTVPARSAFPRFLDELVTIQDDAEDGTASVTCDRPVAALSVLLHGGDFAALATIASAETNAAGPEEAEPEDREDKSHRLLPLVQDGGGFQSNLVVTNLSEAANSCTMHFDLPGMPSARFQDAAGVTWQDSSTALLELASPGSRISLPSENQSVFVSFGHAALECQGPAHVRNLLTVEASDEPAGIAAIAPVQSAREVRFPVTPRLGSLALVLTNSAEADASCEVELALPGRDEPLAAEAPVPVAGRSTALQFLADLFELPEDFTGGSMSLVCDRNIAAVSLPFTGSAFTAMPPVLPVFDLAPVPTEESLD